MKWILLIPFVTFFWMACIENANIAPLVTEIGTTGDEEDTVIHQSIPTEILMGKFDPETHPSFVEIPTKYASNSGMYLQKTVLDSFISMAQAAQRSGINLKIISATRNFERQKAIWERKWEAGLKKYNIANAIDEEKELTIALEILNFSSMPGTSRHHWGTDIDINNLNDEYFKAGRGLEEYLWLVDNAEAFGFCQPYSEYEDRSGYMEEKWHWSFTPISNLYLNAYRKITYTDLIGFKGAKYAPKIKVIEKYVYGVSCF